MDLHLGNSVSHSLRSWLHYCILAMNTDTAARYCPYKHNKTSFCFSEQKLSSFIIAPTWPHKVNRTNKHPSYPIENQTNISKVSICLCFTQLPKAIFRFLLISLNPFMQMHGKCSSTGPPWSPASLSWLLQRTKCTQQYDEVASGDPLSRYWAGEKRSVPSKWFRSRHWLPRLLLALANCCFLLTT